MTTAEAARRAGVEPTQMLEWQRNGWLTPSSNGRLDTMRRLDWSAKDVEDAKKLKTQEGGKSAADAMFDSLGGRAFADALGRARKLQDNLNRGEVVIAGPAGARIVQRNGLIENALVFTGTPAVVLGSDRAV